MADNAGHARGTRESAPASQPPPRQSARTLVFFVTEDWYFCSHRLPLAVAAREAGFNVHVITRVASHGEVIRSAGLELIPLDLARRGMNPLTELGVIRQLTSIYKRLQPDVVHHVAVKPVLYGSIAARLARVPGVVNAMAGLGYLYVSSRVSARLARPLVKMVMRALLNNDRTKVILQNPDDIALMCDSGTTSRERVVLIRGSGVDPDVYRQQPEPQGVPVVMLASRLLWDKGIGEFVEAANSLLAEGCKARFVLVGDGDDANPASVDAATLETWQRGGNVELWGRRKNMPDVLAQAHIVCLPSYREGVPKVLIEAASCGRPIVTTDAPGCREIVHHGENGLLVPVRDVGALAEAIRTLLLDRDLRARMGRAGRELVKNEFTIDAVVQSTLDVYGDLLQGGVR